MLITGWGSIELAVEGMRAGAYDFITKPWNNRVLLQRVATALSLRPAAGVTDSGSGRTSGFDRCGIIGENPRLLEDSINSREGGSNRCPGADSR